MAKRIQVGGRIESKEVGGIVTGAAEILDDAKGKKQSIINGETDDELLRLDQSKQDNLIFDNAPTEGSDNPVKSGGLYTAQQAILLAIAAINELIPSAASALNQLADKAFVNSSISTNTATFRGTSAAGLNEQQFLAWANGLEHDLNDYVFWQTSDAAGNTLFKRYKWNGTEWAYEYTLNNSTFTAEQWEAIQSGITALLVAKLRALPTAEQLIQSFDSKQDVLTFDNVPTLGSTNPVKSSGIFNAIKEVSDALDTFISETEALIPAEATAQNQLADKADVAAKIVAAIPSWKGQYDALTDLQAVTGAKAGDMGCVKTTDSDGHAVLTFYQYSAQGAWVVYYTLRHYAQNKPATTGTTGDYPYNGMGRIELQKNIVNGVNTLTQAMLTQQNTIYVIQYDFTLGEDITVPANCVLEFDGGSISGNNLLTFQNTKIEGNAKILCDIAGTLLGDVDVSWFGLKQDDSTYDNGIAINKVASIATNIHIPSGVYYFKTPINIGNNVKVTEFYCDLVFNGILKNNTAITYSSNNSILKIKTVSCNKDDVDYSDATNTNITGICIKNNKVVNADIVEVNGFNTSIKLLGDGAGCCEIKLCVRRVIRFNYGIWLTQDNGGWCNENYINGIKFDSYSSERAMFETMCAFYIAGPKDKDPNNTSDTYDHINSITIENCCAESFNANPVIYARSLNYCHIGMFRHEDCDNFLVCSGDCRTISIEPSSYGNINVDVEHNKYPIIQNYEISEMVSYYCKEWERNSIVDENLYFVSPSNETVSPYGSSGTQYLSGYIFNVTKGDKFYIKLNQKGRYAYRVIKGNQSGQEIDITPSNALDFLPIPVLSSTTSGVTFRNTSDVLIGTIAINTDKIKQIFVGVQQGSGTIYSTCRSIEPKVINKVGATENRPILYSADNGYQYFDTTLGKPIYWTGTAWVDATGTPV